MWLSKGKLTFKTSDWNFLLCYSPKPNKRQITAFNKVFPRPIILTKLSTIINEWVKDLAINVEELIVDFTKTC